MIRRESRSCRTNTYVLFLRAAETCNNITHNRNVGKADGGKEGTIRRCLLPRHVHFITIEFNKHQLWRLHCVQITHRAYEERLVFNASEMHDYDVLIVWIVYVRKQPGKYVPQNTFLLYKLMCGENRTGCLLKNK